MFRCPDLTNNGFWYSIWGCLLNRTSRTLCQIRTSLITLIVLCRTRNDWSSIFKCTTLSCFSPVWLKEIGEISTDALVPSSTRYHQRGTVIISQKSKCLDDGFLRLGFHFLVNKNMAERIDNLQSTWKTSYFDPMIRNGIRRGSTSFLS